MDRVKTWGVGAFVVLGLAVVVAPPLDWLDRADRQREVHDDGTDDGVSFVTIVDADDPQASEDCLQQALEDIDRTGRPAEGGYSCISTHPEVLDPRRARELGSRPFDGAPPAP